MNQTRGLLRLETPLGLRAPVYTGNTAAANDVTLVFDENGRYLVQAQQALWELRQRAGWICAAASGESCTVALALAAQLPVDRLVLNDMCLFAPRRAQPDRHAAGLRGYARRNLALVTAQVVLQGVSGSELRRFLRAFPGRELCLLENESAVCADAAWNCLCENNLLIPGKCV